MADNTVQTSSADALGVPANLQRRNMIVYVVLVAMTYLSAPITYVDVMHSALIAKLTPSNFLANLPTSANLWMTALPILATWLLPYRWIAKKMVVGCYALQATMGAVVALTLILPTSPGLKIGLLIVHGAILGACSAVGGVYGWEIISRGMSEKMRGWAFGFAFGVGPIFAVLGNGISQYVLGHKHTWISYPHDFALLFGVTFPLIGIMALVALMYHVPAEGQNEKQIVREPFLHYVFGGFGDFIRQKVFVLLLFGYMISFIGWLVYTNGSLNIPNILPGHEPKDYAGFINQLRFGCKMLAGFLIGMLVARRGARSGVVATAALTAAGVLWLLTMRGDAYLGAFALFGAGELAGVYYPNFCMVASKPEHVKRNLSFFFLNGLIPVAAIHGWIADKWSFQTSFTVGLIAALIAVVMALMLPYRKPVNKDKDDIYPGQEDNLKAAIGQSETDRPSL